MRTHLHVSFAKRYYYALAILCTCFSFASVHVSAQGSWKAIKNLAPQNSGGGLLLLSDGTVLCKSNGGGNDGIGNVYIRLTPNASGSYVNGTWSSIAPMHKTRLYYSTQLLKDGRVYVAGGEYGTGGSSGEVYDPLTNIWTNNGTIGVRVSDANSEILEDGRVLQALVSGTLRSTKIYDPVANAYTAGPTCKGIHNESAWLKLPDNSILFVDRLTRKSERYIPSLNMWIVDGTLPVDLYDPFGDEQGGALLLPDGRGIFFGSTGHNAIYTPSGNTSPGTWAAAADFPNGQGTPDAPAAMMTNGKILCAVSPKPTSGNHFPTPTSFYEYDYLTNTFTRVGAPGGGNTVNAPVYSTNFLDLPNGQVLYCLQGFNKYYVYTPDGVALTAGKPNLIKFKFISTGVYMITGTGFNGISEGANYGDDWQMNSNYPLVRLTAGTKIYYARTYNWNSTGVQRGSLPDTAYVNLPEGLPAGTYYVSVIANGFKSNSLKKTLSAPGFIAMEETPDDAITNNAGENMQSFAKTGITVFPNPASAATNISFTLAQATHISVTLTDAGGKIIQIIAEGKRDAGTYSIPLNIRTMTRGIYYISLITDSGTKTKKLVIQ